MEGEHGWKRGLRERGWGRRGIQRGERGGEVKKPGVGRIVRRRGGTNWTEKRMGGRGWKKKGGGVVRVG